MAKITCTVTEYHKFIGPRIRNSIQTLTKAKKRLLKKCQMCEEEKELEAAHMTGSDRKTIIEKILNKYRLKTNKDLIQIDLQKVEEEIMSAHKPIDKCFKFLCSNCHTEYDRPKQKKYKK